MASKNQPSLKAAPQHHQITHITVPYTCVDCACRHCSCNHALHSTHVSAFAICRSLGCRYWNCVSCACLRWPCNHALHSAHLNAFAFCCPLDDCRCWMCVGCACRHRSCSHAHRACLPTALRCWRRKVTSCRREPLVRPLMLGPKLCCLGRVLDRVGNPCH